MDKLSGVEGGGVEVDDVAGEPPGPDPDGVPGEERAGEADLDALEAVVGDLEVLLWTKEMTGLISGQMHGMIIEFLLSLNIENLL